MVHGVCCRSRAFLSGTIFNSGDQSIWKHCWIFQHIPDVENWIANALWFFFLTYKVNYCFDYRAGIAICHKLCGMTKLLLASCFPTYNVYYSQNNTMWDRYYHPGTACHVMAFSSSHWTENAVPFPCATIRLWGTWYYSMHSLERGKNAASHW